MAGNTITIRIKIMPWGKLYLTALKWFCLAVNREPDGSKVMNTLRAIKAIRLVREK